MPTGAVSDIQISRLTALEELDLTGNVLPGLPPGFETLGRLRTLTLRRNDCMIVPPLLVFHARKKIQRLAQQTPAGAVPLPGMATAVVPFLSLVSLDLR